MTEHTPGPWRTQIDDKGDLRLIAGDGHMYWMGNVEDTCGECHANADLIAAAPDLLERLEDARKAIASLPEGALGYQDVMGEFEYPIRDELLRNIDQALGKARGELL